LPSIIQCTRAFRWEHRYARVRADQRPRDQSVTKSRVIATTSTGVASVAVAVMREGFTRLVVEPLAWWVAVAVAFIAFVRLRLRPRIDRDLREVAESRRLLGEVGEGASEGKG